MAAAAERALEFRIRTFEGGPGVPRLERHDVHIWTLPVPGVQSAQCLRDFLSPDELDRASRFRFDKHRDHYVLTRGTLRLLLAGYLGIPPKEISFQYSQYDKPSLAQTAELHFNLSHTDGMALFGFTRLYRIGVDIEHHRSDFRADEIAERFFSPAEREALRKIPAANRHESFFRIWTRKEAYIKALGEGLSHPLHQFDVSLDNTAALLGTRPDPSEAQRWQLENLVISPQFAAAAAVELQPSAEAAR